MLRICCAAYTSAFHDGAGLDTSTASTLTDIQPSALHLAPTGTHLLEALRHGLQAAYQALLRGVLLLQKVG